MESEKCANLAAVLQHADATFPSGSVSFSWGLESLCNQGIVKDVATVAGFVSAHLRGRWASLDRVMMVHAHYAALDLNEVAWLDMLVEAQSLSTEQRMGSSRVGAALLSTHRRLGSKVAEDYAEMIELGKAYGHMPVVQGLIWGQCGFDSTLIQCMGAHGICTSLLGAAVRLSAIGHIDAQIVHSNLIPLIARIVSTPVGRPDECHSFIPQIEIASMKHETDEIRLFVN